MIRAEGVVKTFGEHRILDGLDFRIGRGERVALLGPNGAGKTTLLRCILGITAFRGRLTVAGREAGPSEREARSLIGYVPQRPPVYDLSLGGFIRLLAGLRELEPGAVAERMEALGLDVAAARRKPMRALSGGMLQKALLAVALADRVPVLLLDEPTASLDPRSRRDFLESVRGVGEEVTLLLATHRLEEIERLADRILLLHEGGVVFDGSPEALHRRAGVRTRLWLEIPGERRGEVRAELEALTSVLSVRENGRGLELDLRPGRGLDLLAEVRRRGLPVLDFRTRPPELEEVMERLLAREPGLRGGSQETGGTEAAPDARADAGGDPRGEAGGDPRGEAEPVG